MERQLNNVNWQEISGDLETSVGIRSFVEDVVFFPEVVRMDVEHCRQVTQVPTVKVYHEPVDDASSAQTAEDIEARHLYFGEINGRSLFDCDVIPVSQLSESDKGFADGRNEGIIKLFEIKQGITQMLGNPST